MRCVSASFGSHQLRVLGTNAHVLVAHLQRLSDAHASDQYDPVLELQKIQHALGSLSEAEVQVSGGVVLGGCIGLRGAAALPGWSQTATGVVQLFKADDPSMACMQHTYWHMH